MYGVLEAATVGLFAYSAYQATQGVLAAKISVGDFGTIIWSGTQMLGAVSAMSKYLGTAWEHLGVCRTFFSITDAGMLAEDEIRRIEREGKAESPTVVDWRLGAPEIVFDKVSFRYPGSDKYVLRDVNFKVAPGEFLGIVGESGSGKTTLMNLLMGFYEPTDGEIRINGVPLDKIPKQEWLAHVAYQQQKVPEFLGKTVEQAIMLGDSPDHPPREMDDAVRLSVFNTMLKHLKHGLDTVIGDAYERGQNLSGGEHQLTCAARSLRRNASVTVMDEPTSAVDVVRGHIFVKNLESLDTHEGTPHTRVLISHDMITIARADRILVLSNGEKSGLDVHQVLLEECPLYRRLYLLKAGPALEGLGDAAKDPQRFAALQEEARRLGESAEEFLSEEPKA